MTRLIRIDDFPHGDLRLYNFVDKTLYREKVSSCLSILEENKINYIIGVTPFILNNGDAEFLNGLVKHGRVVMHGFTHGWEKPWHNIKDTWSTGGEFSGLSEAQIRIRYEKAHNVLKNIEKYDEGEFIPPFNCYTQELLNVLHERGIKKIYTCDIEWNQYEQFKMNYHGVEPIMSKYGVTYSDVNVVLENLNDESQITLHWCYDSKRKSWLRDYKTLVKKIKENKENNKFKNGGPMNYSQYGEEIVINNFFRNKKEGFCVDVGAADGVRFSNSRHLIESMEWTALLVEPHPTYFRQLSRLYKNNERVSLENIAVYSTSGEMPFYLYGHDEHAQVSTLSKNFKERVCDKHGDKYEKKPILVQVRTLEKILKVLPQVDFLSVDCEGVDMEVLKSNNWDEFRPTLVCVEHSMPKTELDSFMKSVGYVVHQRTIGNSFFIKDEI